MQPDVQHYINTVWLLVAIYWVVGIVRAKPTVKRESTLSSALHVAMGCAAVLHISDRYGDYISDPLCNVALGYEHQRKIPKTRVRSLTDATMKINMFARLLLHISLGTWTLFASLGVWATTENTDPVVIGEKFQIESKVLAETRTYIIHTPASYKSGKDAYPVLVLQDAEAHFAHTTSAVDLLSGSGRIPRMIVVGINNTDRTRDMTPSKPTTGWGGTPWTGSAGGADKFMSFIADELLPMVDRNYRTRPYRVLIGHSLGGLFAVYALMNRPEVFNGYLAISPALWWDDQALVKASQPFFAAHKDLRADLYMTMGDEGQAMLGGAWKLSAVLEESRLADLRWQFKRSPEEDHGTIPYLSTYEGLQAIFKGYRIADPVALFEQGGLAAFERHYAEVSKRMGYTVAVPMEAYGGMVWELSNRGRFAEAEEIGKKMLELDPKNTMALSTLAQVAVTQKDDARAIGYLTRVLQLYPGNTQARATLVNYKVDVDKIVPSLELSAKGVAPYVGEYRFKDGLVKVAYEKDKLMGTSPAGKCELRALTQTKFYCVDADVELKFNKDSRGRVAGVTAEYPDHIDEYTKVK
jgi:predicted alpha/beta superfamily hydrolase